VFSGVNTGGQTGLWTTDGTASGTHEITGVFGAFAGGLYASNLAVLNGVVLFNGEDTAGHLGLWVTNGTAPGTSEIGGIGGVSGGNANGLDPTGLTAFHAAVLFSGLNAAGQNGLWTTDGTAGGTHELTGIAGAHASGLHPTNFSVFNDVVLFNGEDAAGHFGLWETDGTVAGTHEFTGISGENTATGLNPQYITPFIPTSIKFTTPHTDMNGDGVSDILWQNTTVGQIGFWYSDGTGGFTDKTINQGDTSWQIQGTGDYNGIGTDGFLWQNVVSGQVGFWYANGSGGFTYKTVDQGDPHWHIQGSGDFNGDGTTDILWTNPNSGLAGLWIGTIESIHGGRQYQYEYFNQSDPTWQVQGVGDFNGDGRSDILWRNTASGDISIWNSNNSNGFTYQTISQGDQSWQVQGVDDFNGDGKADILWRNLNNGQVGLWKSNASDGFSYKTFDLNDPTWQIKGTAEFNGDSHADILWRNTTNGQLSQWSSDGADGFTFRTIDQGNLNWNTVNGNDTLIVSATNQTVFSTPGNTTIFIGPGAGHDTIANFQTSQDYLQFDPTVFANYSTAMSHAQQVQADTVFTIDANDSVTLQNVALSSLSAFNFHF
jgi:hypothetical protein